MKFRVTATKDAWLDGPPRNPFRCRIENMGRISTTTRIWEFEADNEAEVRKFWEDAQRQCLEGVYGFRLGTIEALDHSECETMKTPIVCICGSSRFCDLAAVHAWEFEKRGEIALSMHLLPQWYWEATNKVGHDHGAEQEGVAHILDELHLRKIDMADRVFVVNEGGYIGERTAIEIAYAQKLGKPISYATPPTSEKEGSK